LWGINSEVLFYGKAMLFKFASLEQQLAKRAKNLFLVCLEKRGRTLIAADEIFQGSIIHTELPMVATPPPNAYSLARTCATCLTPLGRSQDDAAYYNRQLNDFWRFCSPSCYKTASNEWLEVAQGCNFSELLQACSDGGLKFPFMAARLACMKIQLFGNEEYASKFRNDEELPERGNPLTEFDRLCYANVDRIPEEWSLLYRLINKALQSYAITPAGNSITLSWFAQIMSRLHLNSFRVDTVSFPDDITDRSSFLLRAAAYSISEGGVENESMAPSPGSAVYLLGSMFNHSCEPNVTVTFPSNNSKAVFKAAREIKRNEELTISYVDHTMNVDARRRALDFGYGFSCQCPKCVGESDGICL
jgi:hypothetical protein